MNTKEVSEKLQRGYHAMVDSIDKFIQENR